MQHVVGVLDALGDALEGQQFADVVVPEEAASSSSEMSV
jgi:hypothetical protein